MALRRLNEKAQGSPRLVALSNQDLRYLGLERAHLGEILRHRFNPFPEKGGLEGHTDGRRMAQSSADFAVAGIRAAMKTLEEKAQELEYQSEDNDESATDAFEAACKSLGINYDESKPNEAMEELRYRRKLHGKLTDKEKDLMAKAEIADSARRFDSSTVVMVGLIQELTEDLPPDLTLAGVGRCLDCLEAVLKRLRGPVRALADIGLFPDGPQFEPFLKSLYLFAPLALSDEIARVDVGLKAIAGKKGVEFEETMEFFFAKYFPVRGEFEKRSSFFKMRKAVCEAVRNARLVVEEEENSIETRMGACKQAKRTIQVIFANHSKEEARRNATGEDHQTRRAERKRSKRGSTSDSHISSASLAHQPVARRFVNQ